METFERKAYEKLASWKDSSQGSTALLIEGARSVGKAPSRRNSDDGTMRRICSSTSRKPPMTCWATSSTCATTSTRSSCTCHPSTEWNCTGGTASSFSTRCSCTRRPARPSSSWWLTGVTTTSRRGRLSPSARTSRTSSFHQRRSRSA